MGLDTYIAAERYLSKYFDKEDEARIQKLNEMFGIKDSTDDFRAERVIFNVAYWRKANAIHKWFVENVQDGKDECQKSYVSTEQLQSLIAVCKDVLADNKKAASLLPTTSGFFFGSTQYDEGYYEDLENTVKQLERILKDPALEKMDLYYNSSW